MSYLEAIYKQENRGNWLDNLFSRKYLCSLISKVPSRRQCYVLPVGDLNISVFQHICCVYARCLLLQVPSEDFILGFFFPMKEDRKHLKSQTECE